MNEHTPGATHVELNQPMGILEANLSGHVHGGVIMRLVDNAGGLAAVKHCRSRVVTAAMDEMSFIEPVYLGDIVTVKAQVNDVSRTSMEVGCRVEAENPLSGERRHVSSAYLVFVALDDNGKPREVPSLVLETKEDERRNREAKIRRQHRLARKEEILARRAAHDQGEK